MDIENLTISINGRVGCGKTTLTWFIKGILEYNNIPVKIESIEYDDIDCFDWMSHKMLRLELLKRVNKKIFFMDIDDAIRVYQTFHRSGVTSPVINLCVHSKRIPDDMIDDIELLLYEIILYSNLGIMIKFDSLPSIGMVTIND